MKTLLFSTLLVLFGAFGMTNPNQKVQYTMEQLLSSDSAKVIVSYKNDTLTEMRDKTETSSYSLYTFDKKHNLRFYAFFTSPDKYSYSESFDSLGNLTKREGSLLVQYFITKEQNDTVVFTPSFFSLNKKFNGIEIVSNKGDTIYPQNLYKSKKYSNVKCFTFNLPVTKANNTLVLYSKIDIIDMHSNKRKVIRDTVSFKETQF